jgi:hypothetical protein
MRSKVIGIAIALSLLPLAALPVARSSVLTGSRRTP